MEARASTPAFTPVLAPAISKAPWEKLNAHFSDIYYGKSHMDCYNLCQQCKDSFATVRATGPIRIPFAAFFLRNRISFRLQQYKQKHDADTLALVI